MLDLELKARRDRGYAFCLFDFVPVDGPAKGSLRGPSQGVGKCPRFGVRPSSTKVRCQRDFCLTRGRFDLEQGTKLVCRQATNALLAGESASVYRTSTLTLRLAPSRQAEKARPELELG